MSYAQVKEFMTTFGQSCPEVEITLCLDVGLLRYNLIAEEFQEFKDSQNRVDLADALTDLKYVILGAFVAMGVEIEDGLERIQLANDYALRLAVLTDFEPNMEFLLGEFEISVVQENNPMIISLLAGMLENVNQCAVAYNIDIVACMDEVHASNMSKLGLDGKPIYRDDGKVMKGPKYFVPNLRKVLYGDKDAI